MKDITNMYGDMQFYMPLKKTGVNLKNQKQPIWCVDKLRYMLYDGILLSG